MKSRTASEAAFRPDSASVPLKDAFTDGQTQASATVPDDRAGPRFLERREQVVQLIGRDARPVIRYSYQNTAFLRGNMYFNNGTILAIPDGIFEKIVEDL